MRVPRVNQGSLDPKERRDLLEHPVHRVGQETEQAVVTQDPEDSLVLLDLWDLTVRRVSLA